MTQPRDLIAVADTACAGDEAALKRLATMFHRIAIPPLAIMNNNLFETPETKKTRAWLVGTGILFEFDPKKVEPSAENRRTLAEEMRDDINVVLKPGGLSVEELQDARGDKEKLAEIRNRSSQVTPESFSSIDLEEYFKSVQRLCTNTTRIQTVHLREVEDLDAYAIISGEVSSLDQDDDRATTHYVLKFVLAMPGPAEHVPWQQIIEYRNDPESQKQFAILKNCMSEIARGSLSPAQVEETLPYLLNRFQQALEAHRIPTETSRLEAFVVSTLDVVAKFQSSHWSAVAQSMFLLDHRKLTLLGGESTTPGSEVAYTIEAQQIFSEA